MKPKSRKDLELEEEILIEEARDRAWEGKMDQWFEDNAPDDWDEWDKGE